MFDNLVVKEGTPVVVTGVNQQANFDKKLWNLEYLKKKHPNQTVKVGMVESSDLFIRNNPARSTLTTNQEPTYLLTYLLTVII